MSHPTPPQAQAALDQFRTALRSAEGREIDPLTAAWDDIEKGVVKLLGGAFSPQNPNHRGIALMIASAAAARFTRDLGAFWFPNRAAPEGAALGFAEAIVVVSPVELAVQALSRGKLALLDQATNDLRGVLERARAARPPGTEGAALGPEDYRRLFDPGFVQFVALDPNRAKEAWETAPDVEARTLDEAFGKLPADVPADVKDPMRQEIVGALSRLEAGKPLAGQVPRAAQLVELLVLLHGGRAGTGFAQAELWQDVLLPLLHIGAAENFPPLDDEELDAYKRGADPLLVYVETVPYKTPAHDEDGLLGVFSPEEILLVDACFAGVPTLRVVRAPVEPLAPMCRSFDGAALRASVEKFTAHLAAQAGADAPPPRPSTPEAPGLLDIAVALLDDLSRVVRTVESEGGMLCLRRATEAEASTEAGIDELRKVLQAPRIILASR